MSSNQLHPDDKKYQGTSDKSLKVAQFLGGGMNLATFPLSLD